MRRQAIVPSAVPTGQSSMRATRSSCARGPGDTTWGNPFKVGKDGDAARCCRLCEEWLRKDVARWLQLGELRGRRLRCHCAPGSPCHADSLIVLFCSKMGEDLKEDGRESIVDARRESGSGVGEFLPPMAVPVGRAPDVSRVPRLAAALPAHGNSSLSAASLGELPGQSAAARAYPGTGCFPSMLSGRRESAVSLGELSGHTTAARAFPAAAHLDRGCGNTACTSGEFSGQHPSARAFPAVGSGPASSTKCLVETGGVIDHHSERKIESPPARGLCSP